MADGIDLGIPGLEPATRIGQGGNAVVYRARQPDLDRLVAVKVLNQSDDDTRRRFDRERRAMGRLGEHEGIVSVYSTGFTESGQPYLVMPLMATALDDELARVGTIPWLDAATMMSDVCATVQFAHEQGVVHRDLKPGNLMLTQSGRVLVSDFGIARITTGSATLRSTAIQLTPMYSPPEAFEDETPSASSDVYSLGATLYALLAGHPPLVGPGEAVPFLTLLRRINEQPVDPLGAPVPEAVDDVLQRALAKRAEDRYGSALEMSEALAAATRGDDDTTVPTFPERGVVAAVATTSVVPLTPPLDAAPSVPPQHTTTQVADSAYDAMTDSVALAGPSSRGRISGLVIAAMFGLLVAVGGFVAWSTRDEPAALSPTTSEPTATDASTVVPDSVVEGVVNDSSVVEPSTTPLETPAIVAATATGPGERVEGFRLERTEGPYAVGTADGDGRRDLVLLDRVTLTEVARTPLDASATNTTDVALLESGEMWISVRGQRSIAVFEPPCQCIDRRVPVDDSDVSTLVPLDDTVWLDAPGNRLLGLRSAGGGSVDIAPPTGPDSRLWRAILGGRLVVAGSGGVALLDSDGAVTAGPFGVQVVSPDRNDLDASRLYWSDPAAGTVNTLSADGNETVALVSEPGARLSEPAYDTDRDIFWVVDADGPWVIGLDPMTLAEVERIAVAAVPSDAAPKVGGGLVWMAITGAIIGIDPDDDDVAIRLETGSTGFTGYDVIDDQVWLVDAQNSSAVTRYQLLS